MLIFTIIVAAVFSVLFLAVRHYELKRGRDPYSLKDFILELLNHTGDGSNIKR